MTLLDLLFPKRCLGCGREGFIVCPGCLQNSPRAELVCPECERLAFGGATHPGCRHPLGMDGLVPVWRYEGVVREAVKQLKFKSVKEVVKDLLPPVVGAIREEPRFMLFRKTINLDVLWTGVPLHRMRANWRGFNQAELLAGGLAAGLEGRFVPGLVKRVRFTKQQVGLKGEERGENIRGAFTINSKFLPGRQAGEFRNSKLDNVVLVDDVWTTGATMKEVAKVLKRAGAERVWGFVLAR